MVAAIEQHDVLVLSVVAYAVVMGAVMASGKEVMGRIPKGKVNVSQSYSSLEIPLRPKRKHDRPMMGSEQCFYFNGGSIESLQLVDFEAMTTPSPDGFSKMAKSWMNLKR